MNKRIRKKRTKRITAELLKLIAIMYEDDKELIPIMQPLERKLRNGNVFLKRGDTD